MTDNRTFKPDEDAKQEWHRRTTKKTLKETNNEKDKEQKEESIRTLIAEFCEYTSAHGPGRIYGSKHVIRKVFWSLMFVAAVVVFSMQIYSLFKKFRARPLSTLVRLQHDTSLPFPTVTFCNFNPIRKDWIDNGPDLLQKGFKDFNNPNKSLSLDDHQDFSDEDWETRRKRRSTGDEQSSSSSIDDAGSGYGYGSGDYSGDYDDWYYEDEEGLENPDDLDENFVEEETLISILALVTPQQLQPLGHQFEDMVMSCTYRGVSCRNYTEKFWTTFWHYKYGNCYVFNSGDDMFNRSAATLKSNKAGPSHGLTLELNIQQLQYVGQLTEEAGIKIALSNSGEMPFPLEQGISVAPGFATSVGLRKTTIFRKDPFNNGSCLSDSTMETGNLYRLAFNASYSSMACKESCLAYNQRKRCKCMEYRFPIAKGPICNVMNKTMAKCLSKVQKDFKENKLNCSKACREPCKQEIFKQSTSIAVWPSEENEPYFKNAEKVDYWADYRSDVLKLHIFYEELNFEVIEEQLSYELVNFASDVGGQLGLWIGFSVLTIAEFLELMLLVCHVIIRKCSRIRQSKITDLGKDTELNQFHKD